MANWPSTLPQSPLINSYQEATPDTIIRTGMSVGPDKIRRRLTDNIRKFSFSLFMTKDQIQILDDFIQSTLNGGVDSFVWKNHRTEAAATVRLIGLPTYQVISSGDFYSVGIKMEELP